MSFNYIATSFFIEVYFSKLNIEDAEALAGLYMCIPFLVGAICIPFFGLVVNLIGRRSHILIVATSLGTVSFISLYASNTLFALILLGIAYTLFATVLWPTVTMVLNKSILAFAFGYFSSVINLTLFLFQIVVMMIYHKTNSYYMVCFLILFSINYCFVIDNY